jgi:hypothetical protein
MIQQDFKKAAYEYCKKDSTHFARLSINMGDLE